MKKVIIYAYYMKEESDYNLEFFVKFELKYREDIDYIIVINGFEYGKNIIFPELNNLKIIKRENKGFDFGAYNCALKYIEDNNKYYDYYIFLNCSVFGPILPSYYLKYCNQHWSKIFTDKINDKVKLVGTTIVCLPTFDLGGSGPKIEGFFFVVDNISLQLLKNKKSIFCDHITFKDCIVNGEYGLSRCIFENGYTIDCMIPKYQNIDWTKSKNHKLNNCIHPSRFNSFYGNSINPYDVIFHKWLWKNESNFVNFDIVFDYVNSFDF